MEINHRISNDWRKCIEKLRRISQSCRDGRRFAQSDFAKNCDASPNEYGCDCERCDAESEIYFRRIYRDGGRIFYLKIKKRREIYFSGKSSGSGDD